MSRIAVIDSQVAGISGDMLLSSLIDAGADKKKVISAIYSCQDFYKGSKISHVSFDKIVVHGFNATRLHFKYGDRLRKRRGLEMRRSLSSCLDSLGVDDRAKTFALESLNTIITAEAAIHGEEFSDVHLHEFSSIDTLADLVGCAVALQDLQLLDARILSTSVAVGGGLLHFSHGIVPNPSPAILEIFKGKGFSLTGGPASHETTTPTGAAMLVNLVSECVNYYPPISPEKVGYGAGTKDFDSFANVTRLLVGTSPLAWHAARDSVLVVETNVDDITGQLLGNLVERLGEAGARDVSVIAGTSKKSRPTHLIRIISDNFRLNEVLEILFNETATLGARVQQVERFVLPRSILTIPVNVKGSRFNLHVKIGKDSAGKAISAAPEFEDVRIIASKTGLSVKKTLEMVSAEITNRIGKI